MSLNVTFNGSMFIIPETGEVGWGGNTTSYLVAIAAGALQKTGGSFTLSAEIDFGAAFGLKSLYYKSRSANIAATGILRLANDVDQIRWRNQANSNDLTLYADVNDRLVFNGSTVYVIGAGTITNADIAPGAGIVYSKLNLTNSIVNADINAAAAIAYSKLNLVGSIVNADVNAAAAIAYSKLNLSNSVVNADINAAAAIAYSKLNLSNSIVNADVNTTAAIALTKLAAVTVSRMLVSNTSGFIAPSAWSYDATDNLTTGVQDELRFQDGGGGDYVYLRAPAAVTTHGYDLPIAPGTAGQVLSWQTGGQLQWINAAGGGTINSGLAGFFTYYPANGTTVDDQPVLSTNGTTQVYFADGTVGAPVISFASATTSGFYKTGADSIRYSASGVNVLSFIAAGLEMASATGVIRNSDGTALLPSYTHQSDQDTGTYLIGGGNLGFSMNGVLSMQILNDFVGIGSITPSVALHIQRTVSDTTNRIVISNQNGTSGQERRSFVTATGDNNVNEISLIGGKDSSNVAYEMLGGTTFIQFGTGGTERARMTSAGAFNVGDGSVSLPSLSFNSDTNTGWFWNGADAIRAAAGGVEILKIYRTDATNLGLQMVAANATIENNTGTEARPSYTFSGENDCGMWNSGTNTLAWSTNAQTRLTLNTTSLTSVLSIVSTEASANAIKAESSFNGTNPRVRAINTNGTSGQNRIGLIGASGDAGNVECSITAGKDSSNNNVEMVSGTTKLQLGIGGIEYLRVSTAGLNFTSTSAQGIVGTTTNDNALAGNVGQQVSATVNGQNAGTTNQYSDVTSITLTAGDWDVSAFLAEGNNGATITDLLMGISVTPGNSSAGLVPGDNQCRMAIPTAAMAFSNGTVPQYRVSIGSTTTYYLKNFISYSVATPLLSGRISARRVR